MSDHLDLLEKLAAKREAAKYAREQWFKKLRETHGLPKFLDLEIRHETGEVWGHKDADKKVLATASKEEVAQLAQIPSDATYERWEREILRQVAASDN